MVKKTKLKIWSKYVFRTIIYELLYFFKKTHRFSMIVKPRRLSHATPRRLSHAKQRYLGWVWQPFYAQTPWVRQLRQGQASRSSNHARPKRFRSDNYVRPTRLGFDIHASKNVVGLATILDLVFKNKPRHMGQK